jgi:hypothetical protein
VDAAACPKLDGNWEGAAKGELKAQPPSNVSGTMTVTLVPSKSGGDYDVAANSNLTVIADVAPTIPITTAMSGTVRCGVLDTINDTDVVGMKVTYHLQGHFDESGCKDGTWTAKTVDGNYDGAGTFELHRKQ